MIETVGKNIRAHRTAQKMTIAELAEKADISDSFISRLEFGTVGDTHVSKLTSVADALGLTVGELFSNTNVNPYTVELISKLTSLPPEKQIVVSKRILDLLNMLMVKNIRSQNIGNGICM